MNRTEWLEKLIDEVEKRLLVASQHLKKKPTSYSSKVAIQSAERSLTDLKNNLQNERKKYISSSAKAKQTIINR